MSVIKMPKIPKIPKIPTLIRNDAQKPLKTHSCPIDVLVLSYACADSSKWGLFGRYARSAFRRTPSGPETYRELDNITSYLIR